MESNIKIKATVPEMSDFFEKDGGVRHYEIKDKRYTQQDLDSMSEAQYNSEVFVFAVCYRHMELEKPLTGTFTVSGLMQKMNALREADRLRNTPVYKQTAEYAREHDELPLYRESNKLNIACKKAIEDAIRSNYANNCLNTKAVSEQIKEQFGTERMSYVLANTVQAKDWDGRISNKNKAWAKTVPVCQEKDAWGGNRNAYFVVDQAHPGLVDLLVTHVREELAAEKDAPKKRASVLEKLHKNAAAISPAKAPASRVKEPEL